MKTYTLHFYKILLFLMVCPITASGTPLPDSLLTREHIYEYTFSDTAKAARIIDLMRERRLAPEHVLDIAEGDQVIDRFTVIILQHETDHLDGHLFTDLLLLDENNRNTVPEILNMDK